MENRKKNKRKKKHRTKKKNKEQQQQGASVNDPQSPETSVDGKSSRKRKKSNRANNDSASSDCKKKKHCTQMEQLLVKPTSQTTSKPSSLLDKMRARLSGGYFRMLNERLSTCRGHEAFEFFKNNPSLFDAYHTGYQEQMSHWPQQPVDIFIKWLKNHGTSLVVADFGCGDAKLAKSVKNKVFSLDLVSCDPSVIACNMAHTPLNSTSVDVAVFCLSLMGTDFPEYLKEAYRVLRPRGWLLIAEVKSRFDPSNGGADPDKFIKSLQILGFKSVSKDFTNKMFLLFYFQKVGAADTIRIDWPQLKPCIYKRR